MKPFIQTEVRTACQCCGKEVCWMENLHRNLFLKARVRPGARVEVQKDKATIYVERPRCEACPA